MSLRIDEKKWENYYFVLEQDFLAYFLSLHDKRSYSPEGLIPLDDIHSIGEVDFSKPHTLQIVTSKKLVKPNIFNIELIFFFYLN